MMMKRHLSTTNRAPGPNLLAVLVSSVVFSLVSSVAMTDKAF